MSKRDRGDRGPLIVLGLLVIIIVLVSVLGLLSRHEAEHQKRCAAYASTNDQQVEEYNSVCPDDHVLFGDGMAQWFMAMTGFMALGVSAWAVWLLKDTLKETRAAVKAADDAVEVTRDIGNRQLRAYVVSTNGQLRNFDIGKQPQLVVTMLNSGQTPAYEFRAWIGGGIGSHDPNFPVPDGPGMRNIAGGVIGPGCKHYLNLFLDSPLTPDQASRLENGTWSIRAVGGAAYKDIFGRDRSVKFNLYYGGGLPLNRGLALSHAPHGNNAT